MCQRCGRVHQTHKPTTQPRQHPENEMLMLKRDPSPQPQPRNPLALLQDPRVSGQLRRSVAQGIGQQHGNRYLQRMLLQRQADPMLRAGSKGDAVERLQSMLVECGASITVDGMFGMKTKQAVVAFQQAAGLSPDGIVGPQTWSKLSAGGVKIPANGAGTAPGSQLVLAKLHEVKTLMKQLSQSGKAPQPATAANTTVPGIAPNADSEDGESSWWDKAKETASDAANSVSDAAGSAWDSTKEAVGGAASSVSQAAGEAWDTAKEAAGGTWDAATGIVGGIVDDAKQKTGEIVQGIQQKVNQGIDEVVQGVSDVAKEVGTSVEEFTSELKNTYASEIAAVQEFVNDVKHYLAHPEEALQKLEEILNGLKKKAAELFGDEPGADDKEVKSGTVAPIETMLNPTICRDAKSTIAPAPGMRRLKLKPALGASADIKNQMPDGGQMNYDSVRPTVEYVPYKTKNDSEIVQVPPTEFGRTGARIKLDNSKWVAESGTDFVTVSTRLLHTISYAISDRPGRTDVPPDLTGIDEKNWRKAADDLDPDVHKTSLGAPTRSEFWAQDLTIAHEEFHVKDGDDYVKDKVVPALEADMATRTIDVPWIFWRDTEVEEQVHKILVEMSKKAAAMRNTYMDGNASETRTYAADEGSYRARAGAIRKLAKDKGWK